MAKAKKTDTELVTEHIGKLPEEVRDVVQYLREVILGADKQVGEQIKWNSPSFYYTGEMAAFDPKEYKRDMIVMNLHRGKIMLVLPTGAKLKDTSGLLEGKYTDGRRLITFKDLDDVKAKEGKLVAIVKEWIGMVEK